MDSDRGYESDGATYTSNYRLNMADWPEIPPESQPAHRALQRTYAATAHIYDPSITQYMMRSESSSRPVHQLPMGRIESSPRPVHQLPMDRIESSPRPMHQLPMDRIDSLSRAVYNTGIDRSESTGQQVYNPEMGRMESTGRQVYDASFDQIFLQSYQQYDTGTEGNTDGPTNINRITMPVSTIPQIDYSEMNSFGLSFSFWHLPQKRSNISSYYTSLTGSYSCLFLFDSDFDRCFEPWALSAILDWVKSLVDDMPFILGKTLVECIAALFMKKVPSMGVSEAGFLAMYCFGSMLLNAALFEVQNGYKFGTGEVCEVLIQLTGSGCYSRKVHDEQLTGKCYSHHCRRITNGISTSNISAPLSEAMFQPIIVPNLPGRRAFTSRSSKLGI